MSPAIIEVENLSKLYRLGVVGATTLSEDLRRLGKKLRGEQSPPDRNEFWALRDISFNVQPGEVVGIIGRNGAGKSTLLKILSRITEPTSGRVRLRGRVASLLEVGTGFHPDLTGRENVFLNGAILGMKRAEIAVKFDEIVAFAEVEKFIDTPVKHYSSGMRMRLAFAVAAHLEPELLIIDEVLAVGDLAFQKRCLGKIREVANGGHTVLFVSHSTTAIRALCTRGLVLEEGRIALDGNVADALDRYAAQAFARPQPAWRRPATLPTPPLRFTAVETKLSGHQPALTLKCQLHLQSDAPVGECLVALDICDQSLSVVMQALPSPYPFIKAVCGRHRIDVEIDLPPLIPGLYSLDLWLGRQNIMTAEYLKSVVAFEIVESPTPGRTFPHTPDRGFVVPVSRYSYFAPDSPQIAP